MSKVDKEILKITSSIDKNCENKNWQCMHPFCQETSINSHLLQRNGILNTITENGHLIEIKPNDFFKIEKDGLMKYKRVGINESLSQPLFCNKHDSEIFKLIETYPIKFNDYKIQLLFSYRSLCGELRKKHKALEKHKRILSSHIIQSRCSSEYTHITVNAIKENEIAIKYIGNTKKLFEEEIDRSLTSNFVFHTYSYEIIKISVSAAFNPIQTGNENIFQAMNLEKPLNTVFVNVIPQEDILIIIIGYHKKYCNKWIIEYINSWSNLDKAALQKKLTDLIATKVESWSIAPSLFESISHKNKQEFVKYWCENATNFSVNQSVAFNFFGE